MILAAFILICIGMRLQAFDFIESDHYDLLSNWRIKSVAKEPRVRSQLPREKFELSCGDLHKTDAAPYTAIILFKSSGYLFCMGSIIDHSHILTSKRSVSKENKKNLRVLVGYYKPWWGEFAQIRKVVKLITHDYEMALLKLNEKIIFTDYIKPVKLLAPLPKGPEKKEAFEEVYPPPYTVVGFFVDRLKEPGSSLSEEKTYELKSDNFFDFEKCKENYTTLQLDSEKLFCTFGEAQYCWGGAGSPVLKVVKKSDTLVGVVVAYSCTADTTGPFVVARTDVFGDWIRKNTRLVFSETEK